MRKTWITLSFLVLAVPMMSGCVAAIAAAGAGFMIGDEINEGDGNFDPLEEVRGVGDGKN